MTGFLDGKWYDLTYKGVTPTLFDQPPAQRHSATSRAAAEQIKPARLNLRGLVLAYITANGPVTDEEIAWNLNLNPSTARPRRIELVAEGLVRAHYEAKRTSSGRQATAWVVST